MKTTLKMLIATLIAILSTVTSSHQYISEAVGHAIGSFVGVYLFATLLSFIPYGIYKLLGKQDKFPKTLFFILFALMLSAPGLAGLLDYAGDKSLVTEQEKELARSVSHVLTQSSLGEKISYEDIKHVSKKEKAVLALIIKRNNQIQSARETYLNAASQIDLSSRTLAYQSESILKQVDKTFKQLEILEQATKDYTVELPKEIKALNLQSDFANGAIFNLEKNFETKQLLQDFFDNQRAFLKTVKTLVTLCQNSETEYDLESDLILFYDDETIAEFQQLATTIDKIADEEAKIMKKIAKSQENNIKKLDDLSK